MLNLEASVYLVRQSEILKGATIINCQSMSYRMMRTPEKVEEKMCTFADTDVINATSSSVKEPNLTIWAIAKNHFKGK